MDDFHHKHFLQTHGIFWRILIMGILTSIIFLFASIIISILTNHASWIVVMLIFWFIFMVIYSLKVIKDNIPNRKGAVRRSSVMETHVVSPGKEAISSKQDSIVRNMRYKLVEKPVDLKNYILKKDNRNILICGTPGSGKSLLTRYLLELFNDYQKVIFNFKARDIYLQLGEKYPIFKMKNAAPNPFSDSEAFTNAFMTTFHMNTTGIQGASVESLVRDNAKNTKTWNEFNEKLIKNHRTTKDKNIQAAISYIQTQTVSLISKIAPVELGNNNIVFDFSGLNESQKTFYAELLLRQIWEEIQKGTRNNLILCIDEAHRLTRSGHYTIYREVAREIRAFGFLWTVTQFYTDMNEASGFFDTQFVFKTTEKKDLDALNTIDPKLSWAVSSMPSHTFTDAGYGANGLHYVVPEFILYYTPKDLSPKYINQVATPESEEQQVAEQKINFDQEVWIIISKNGMDYVYNIAKQIMVKYPNYVYINKKGKNDTRNYVKRKVYYVLQELKNNKLVEKQEKTAKGIVIYAKKQKNMSSDHKYMEKEIISILKSKNIPILKVSKSGGHADPDIETPDLNIEIETGKKHSVKDLKDRLKITTKLTVIILPNDEVLQRYSKFKNKNVHVVSLENFDKYLESQLIKI